MLIRKLYFSNHNREDKNQSVRNKRSVNASLTEASHLSNLRLGKF